MLCGYGCESVSHVLWECPAHSNIRANLMIQLQASLWGEVVIHTLELYRSSFQKSSFIYSIRKLVMGRAYLDVVKVYVSDVWEERKYRL